MLLNTDEQALLDGKLHEWCFTKSMLAGHGLSLLLTAEVRDACGDRGTPRPRAPRSTGSKCVRVGLTLQVGGEQRSILVDGGPREDLWELNATQAQVQTQGRAARCLPGALPRARPSQLSVGWPR